MIMNRGIGGLSNSDFYLFCKLFWNQNKYQLCQVHIILVYLLTVVDPSYENVWVFLWRGMVDDMRNLNQTRKWKKRTQRFISTFDIFVYIWQNAVHFVLCVTMIVCTHCISCANGFHFGIREIDWHLATNFTKCSAIITIMFACWVVILNACGGINLCTKHKRNERERKNSAPHLPTDAWVFDFDWLKRSIERERECERAIERME